MSVRGPTFRQVHSVFRTLAPLLLTGALAVASQPKPDMARECLAASLRWRQFGCAISDLDGDNQADFAFPVQAYGAAERPAFLSVHLSSTQASYELPLPADRPALAFVLRDVNGDGFVDIALIGGLNQTVGVFLNDGSGRFEFDRLDRYVTAPSTDFSQLRSPNRYTAWLCEAWSSGSESAAVRSEHRLEFVKSAEVRRPDVDPVHLPRSSDPPRSRAP